MEKEFVTRQHWFGFSDAWHGDKLNADAISCNVEDLVLSNRNAEKLN